MKKKKTKSYTLNEHRLALTKYFELTHEWNYTKSIIIEGFDIDRAESTLCLEDFKNVYHNIDLLRNICELRLVVEKPTIDTDYLYEVLQKLYAYIAELTEKLKNLEKIIISISKENIPFLNFDRRKLIRNSKHNFRHFDDEDNLELNINKNNRQFNSKNLIQWTENLKKNLKQLLQTPVLAIQ
ncbi:hypothetical protein [Epilithonimonas mollis]|uniref:Uncharacterized protein n=1 Tax=Epilithonimonas mollis TaxID=216903 RepID=A0A1M6UIE8_9FLAO|nr:hypothetical protein [Epilithonimonas mollis]SHK68946.1 hypothetical protein SAMN05444371_3305 [Epilithonimonas mollis]